MADIPKVPGVPNLSTFADDPLEFLIADAVAVLLGFGNGPQWGIFLDGESVIDADSTISFEYKQDTPISDYPVEQGGFQSYDKVQLPADIKLRMAAGGSVTNRQNFLTSINAELNTTDLYDIVTPEQVYVGYNFVHIDFKRTSENGVGLIVADLWLTEVRETSTANFTDTQQPGDAGQQSNGNVQPQTANDYINQNFATGNWMVQ